MGFDDLSLVVEAHVLGSRFQCGADGRLDPVEGGGQVVGHDRQGRGADAVEALPQLEEGGVAPFADVCDDGAHGLDGSLAVDDGAWE